MYHLCTTATYPAIYHKRKILDIRLNIKDFSSVGVTGFEPATTRPPGTGSGTCDRHGGGATGRTTRPRRSDPAAYADMEPPGAAALPQPRIPLLPHADDRHAEQGGDGHEALPQRIRRGDGGIAPHGRPRRDRRMAPHGVPVIGRIGYSSGVSM